MHKKEVEEINRMEQEWGSMLNIQEEVKKEEVVPKREKKLATKIEAKNLRIMTKEAAEHQGEGAGTDSMSEGDTDSDIDMEEEESKSPSTKCRPNLSRISTVASQ